MAIHLIRKLLTYPTPTTNYTNTTPCTNFCDPTYCDFDECYPLPYGGPGPFPPLPPPLPPSTTVVATPSTTHNGFYLPPLVIVVIILLASVFLLISYYAIVIKYCTFWTRLIHRRDIRGMPQSDHSSNLPLANDHSDVGSSRFDPVVDHPIWLIATVGLHQSIINTITVIRYNKDEGLIDGTDCLICLSEFQQGETLRLLPKCKHAFHIECIDTWLRSHTNCPLCRASIVVNTGIGSNEPSFGHSRRTELTQMVDSDSSDVELGSTQMGNNTTTNNVSSLLDHNRGEIEDFEVDNQDQNKVEIDDNSITILVRRSYSMDYRNNNVPNSQQNSNSNTSSFPFIGSSSTRPQQPPRVRNMKRSYSWSERVFWSAHNRNDRNSDISP